MKIVADTNRLIAVLIKDGGSREILRNSTYEFLTPAFAFEEIWKHRKEIAEKAGLTDDELLVFIFLLFYRVRLLPLSVYNSNMKEAIYLIGENNKKDATFIAVALALKIPLWTHDKELKNQKRVKIITNHDLLESNL